MDEERRRRARAGLRDAPERAGARAHFRAMGIDPARLDGPMLSARAAVAVEAAGGVPLLELTEIARHRARPGRRDAHYSVNANERDGRAAVEQLDRAGSRWGDTLEPFVGLRVPMDRFAEAFDFAGVKATLRFD